jgi:hypothetical protein
MERINQDIWEIAVVSTWFGIFVMVIFEPAPAGEPALDILVRGLFQLLFGALLLGPIGWVLVYRMVEVSEKHDLPKWVECVDCGCETYVPEGDTE